MLRSEMKRVVQRFVDHTGMFVLRGTFYECCAFLDGLNIGVNGELLAGFPEWIRSIHPSRPELAWPSLILEIAIGSASVTDLSQESDDRARELLFELITEFLAAELE